MDKLNWLLEPLKYKDGTPTNGVLSCNSNEFIITTHTNPFLSTDIFKAKRVMLHYNGEFKSHVFFGKLEQMKELAQQIKDNQSLFNRFTYFNASYSNNDEYKDVIDFDSL